jgi:hypothetical protein
MSAFAALPEERHMGSTVRDAARSAVREPAMGRPVSSHHIKINRGADGRVRSDERV